MNPAVNKPRCNRPMRVIRLKNAWGYDYPETAFCGRPEGHGSLCYTVEAWQRKNAAKRAKWLERIKARYAANI